MNIRLDELRRDLAVVFGRLAKWQIRCEEQIATSAEDQIRLAEEVLAEPCTGTVIEAQGYWLGLHGVATKPAPHPYTPTGF